MDIAGKRLVVIGGGGLIGSHLVDRLVIEPVSEVVVFDDFTRGQRTSLAGAVGSPKLRIVEGSVIDPLALREVLQHADGVFLLASLWLGECVSDPRRAWEVNTLGTWNVIEACLDAGVRRVVYSSSASVYGNPSVIPMTEDHPFNNRTTYGATKIANEQMFRAIYTQQGLPYIGFRYMNVYGPRMDYRGVYVSVIMKALDRILADQPPIIYGDGSQTYDFVYVDDVAEANVLGMQSDCVDEFFNIGSGVGTSITELVRLLLALAGSDLEPEYRAQEQSFVTHRVGSTLKVEALLAFKARTALIDGLRRVLEWRRQQVAAA
jgi:UDP-glucose 4-epimerase